MSKRSFLCSVSTGLLILLSLTAGVVPLDAIAATVTVSGGGSGLRDAVNAANNGDTIQVTDSSDYECFVLTKQLIIEAVSGQTPQVTAGLGGATSGGEAIRVADDGVA